MFMYTYMHIYLCVCVCMRARTVGGSAICDHHGQRSQYIQCKVCEGAHICHQRRKSRVQGVWRIGDMRA